eukprot:TRINITY_DN3890_c0_g1_i22.p1 TRINITY_DN3890_c0_g1~~TRINITY_DN3890_c0_g1_i22.p1  ORF type:complete len:172 (+),score=33.44 TRINITY_DN3890_c0_g1_i22:25-516(+)
MCIRDRHIFEVDFHPNVDLLASCYVNGEIKILQYSSNETNVVGTFDFHKESCRTCKFSPDGLNLLTGSTDKSIGLIDAQGVFKGRIKRAHENPIHTLHFTDNNTFATGDDEGMVKLWDLRSNKSTFRIHEHGDTITALDHKDCLLYTSPSPRDRQKSRMPSSA